MKKLQKYGFRILLVTLGIAIGVIITSGFDNTPAAMADIPEMSAPGNDGSTNDSGTTNSNNAIYALGNAFADVAEKVNPAVVTISTESTVRGNQMAPWFPFEDFFGRGQNPRQQREQKQRGLGSGVIVMSNGTILTNNHVVENADDITIRLIDGREFPAEVKGTDKRTDLAVLKIDADNLPAVNFANSDQARVGEWVLAIGSPFQEQFAHTVTSGIISAKGRTGVGLTLFEDFIQTDAAINPGNSGGALVNIRGELIGINTAIASRTGANIGIGFAIPSNLARKVMSDILDKGKVVRGWLGVQISNISSELAKSYNLATADGVLVREVVPNSPAQKADLEVGDVIIELDGRKIHNVVELTTKIGSSSPGKVVKMTVIRDNKEKIFRVTLEEFPEEQMAQAAGQQRQTIESLGMNVQDLNNRLRTQFAIEDNAGAVVIGIRQQSIADQAGLEVGDLILKINRSRISNSSEFKAAIEALEPGDAVALLIKRNNRRMLLDFVLPGN